MRSMMIAAALTLGVAVQAHADMCCYVVPVEITLQKGPPIAGFLKLYGEEIHGKESKSRTHVVAFGMNSPSTPERLWEGVPYDFREIRISKRDVQIEYDKKGGMDGPMDKTLFEIKDVDYFFTPGGVAVYEKSSGGNAKAHKTIPMKDIKRIRRTGALGSDSEGQGD
jgi:hypothetical protein